MSDKIKKKPPSKKFSGKPAGKFKKSDNQNKNFKKKKTNTSDRKRTHEQQGEPSREHIEVDEAQYVVEEVVDETEKKKKKTKHKRIRITEQKDLDKKAVLETLNEDVCKFYSKKLGNQLTELEKADYSIASERGDFFFLQENETLEDFLTRTETTLKHKDGQKKFNLICLSEAAIRCVDFKRLLEKTGQEAKCLKLFGKHLKLKEQITQIEKIKHVDFAVATIQRFNGLVKEKAIKLDEIDAVLFDWNFRNVKYKRMIDEKQQAETVCDYILKLNKLTDIKLLFF